MATEVATRDGHARTLVTTKVCDTEVSAATLFDATAEVQKQSLPLAAKAAVVRSTRQPAIVAARTGDAGTCGHRTECSWRDRLRESRGRDGWHRAAVARTANAQAASAEATGIKAAVPLQEALRHAWQLSELSPSRLAQLPVTMATGVGG